MVGEQEAPAGGAKAGGYAWYVLFVLVIVYAFNFIDRQILSILVGDIKRDLGVSDAQIGFLYGTAFAVFYALFGIPLGRLADSWYRGRLVAIGLALWSTMTAASGFANNFTALAAARIGVGIGEASASPAAYSMIADTFPEERRATALSVYSAGLYIGAAMSLPLGGFVLSRWKAAYPDPTLAPLGLEGWQAAFLTVGLPGLLLAIWVLTLREPGRRGPDGRAQPVVKPGAWAEFGRELMAIIPPLTLVSAARIPGGGLVRNLIGLAIVVAVGLFLYRLTGDAAQWIAYGLGVYAIFSWVQSLKFRDPPAFRLIWGSHVSMLLIAGFASIAFVTYAIGFWFPHHLEENLYGGTLSPARYFAGLTAKEEIGLIIGFGGAITSIIGVVGGGYISDRWRQKNPRGRLYLILLTIILPLPGAIVLLNTKDLDTFYLIFPFTHTISSGWVGAGIATMQDLVLPRMRATMGATYLLGSTMIGLALGPYFAGKMSMIAGDLISGLYSLYFMPPLTIGLIAYCAWRLPDAERSLVARAQAAGEPI